MTIDPRIPTMPGRSTSGFHQPGRHCLHQARSALRYSASRMKGELHPSKWCWGGGDNCGGESSHNRGCPFLVQTFLTSYRLSSSSVQPSVSINIFRVQWLFLGLTHRNDGRVACANERLRSHASGEILSSTGYELRKSAAPLA